MLIRGTNRSSNSDSRSITKGFPGRSRPRAQPISVPLEILALKKWRDSPAPRAKKQAYQATAAHGRTSRVMRLIRRPAFRILHSICKFSQKRGDWPKKRPSRNDVSNVISRLLWMISLIRRGATPNAFARLFCDSPIGFRYSSKRISPGVTLCKFELIIFVG